LIFVPKSLNVLNVVHSTQAKTTKLKQGKRKKLPYGIRFNDIVRKCKEGVGHKLFMLQRLLFWSNQAIIDARSEPAVNTINQQIK